MTSLPPEKRPRPFRGIFLVSAGAFIFTVPVFLDGCVKPSVHKTVLMDLAQTQGRMGRLEEENKSLKSALAKGDLEIKRLEDDVLNLKGSEQIHIQDKERLAQKNIELSSEVAQLNRLVSALSETTHFQDKRLEKLREDLQKEAEARQKEENIKLELLQEVEARRREMDRLKTTYDRLVGELQNEIREGEIKVTQALDRLSVNLVEKILFDSGSVTIKSRGLEVLGRVGSILSKLVDKEIQIEGHTDNVPIGGKLKEKYPSNWELSAARAITVVRYLSEVAGIDSRYLSAVGQGESQPIASNETPEGRAQNRRIEIILSPLEPNEILDQLKPTSTSLAGSDDQEKNKSQTEKSQTGETGP